MHLGLLVQYVMWDCWCCDVVGTCGTAAAVVQQVYVGWLLLALDACGTVGAVVHIVHGTVV